MHIGITLNLGVKSVFNNGLNQNTIYLYDLLSKIDIVKNVSFLDYTVNKDYEKYQEYSWLDGYDVIQWNEIDLKKLDMLIILGVFPADEDLKSLKNINKKIKIVSYVGGNSMIMQTEDVIFSQRWHRKEQGHHSIANHSTSNFVDQVWLVPQQEYHNLHFTEIIYKTDALSVPFIWSPKYIDEYAKKSITLNKDHTPYFDDKPEIEKWKIGATEPNINIVKTSYPIMFMFEYAYTSLLQKDRVEHFNIMNGKHLMDNPTMISSAKRLEIFKDNKLVFDKRYNISFILSRILDMVVSHQWGNALNYAYLDTVYFGAPLIHNAHLCPDIGYYYEDYNLKDGAALIKNAMDTRLSDTEYTQRNRKIIERYQADHNSQMVEQYKELLISVLNGGKIKGSYNYKTNLIE